MGELLETLRNTDTQMYVEHCELGIRIGFIHVNAGEPKKFEFIVSDADIGAFDWFDINGYIMRKLEWFLRQIGVMNYA